MEREVGFIGLGRMGSPMVENLIKAGIRVRVFNRSKDKAAKSGLAGALVCNSASDAIIPGGVVFTMLADDAALQQAFTPECVARLGPGGLHISMSTVSPATAAAMARMHQAVGACYVASPVFGGPEQTAAAQLWICMSGDPAAKARARPLLEKLGRDVEDMGEDPAAANVVKLCGNFLIAAATEALSEAFTVAEKQGVDLTAMNRLLCEKLFGGAVYPRYGSRVLSRRHLPAGFQLLLGLKDMRLTRGMADSARVPMPLADIVFSRLLSQAAKGRGDEHWTGLASGAREDAGLPA